MKLSLLLVTALVCAVRVRSQELCSSQKELWKYTEVRPDAHMFWWLYCTTNSAGYSKVPLVLWLQGGPGGSSTGFGNFGELGPLDVNLKPRNTTWLQEVNLLFIDNPVGTGYSYVGPQGTFTTDVAGIAKDLLTTLRDVLKQAPQFQIVPFYIFSESYGGKMTAAFSQLLLSEIKRGSIQCNFKGLAMGDSWISPIDSVVSWGPYLYATSLLDEHGLAEVNKSAAATGRAVASGDWNKATQLWQSTEDTITDVTGGVNFYNILKWGNDDRVQQKIAAVGNSYSWNSTLAKLYARHVGALYDSSLDDLMNGPIRKKLGIIPSNVTWGGQSDEVFSHQSGDFMKDVISVVDDLLKTPLKVVVYSGQLDLIVDTMGTETWVRKLTWPDLPKFLAANREAINGRSGTPEAFIKRYKNLQFYWIMEAGHMVPADNGNAALEMLRMVTKP